MYIMYQYKIANNFIKLTEGKYSRQIYMNSTVSV